MHRFPFTAKSGFGVFLWLFFLSFLCSFFVVLFWLFWVRFGELFGSVFGTKIVSKCDFVILRFLLIFIRFVNTFWVLEGAIFVLCWLFFSFVFCIDVWSLFCAILVSFWGAFGKLLAAQIDHFWHRFWHDFRTCVSMCALSV